MVSENRNFASLAVIASRRPTEKRVSDAERKSSECQKKRRDCPVIPRSSDLKLCEQGVDVPWNGSGFSGELPFFPQDVGWVYE